MGGMHLVHGFDCGARYEFDGKRASNPCPSIPNLIHQYTLFALLYASAMSFCVIEPQSASLLREHVITNTRLKDSLPRVKVLGGLHVFCASAASCKEHLGFLQRHKDTQYNSVACGLHLMRSAVATMESPPPSICDTLQKHNEVHTQFASRVPRPEDINNRAREFYSHEAVVGSLPWARQIQQVKSLPGIDPPIHNGGESSSKPLDASKDTPLNAFDGKALGLLENAGKLFTASQTTVPIAALYTTINNIARNLTPLNPRDPNYFELKAESITFGNLARSGSTAEHRKAIENGLTAFNKMADLNGGRLAVECGQAAADHITKDSLILSYITKEISSAMNDNNNDDKDEVNRIGLLMHGLQTIKNTIPSSSVNLEMQLNDVNIMDSKEVNGDLGSVVRRAAILGAQSPLTQCAVMWAISTAASRDYGPDSSSSLSPNAEGNTTTTYKDAFFNVMSTFISETEESAKCMPSVMGCQQPVPFSFSNLMMGGGTASAAAASSSRMGEVRRQLISSVLSLFFIPAMQTQLREDVIEEPFRLPKTTAATPKFDEKGGRCKEVGNFADMLYVNSESEEGGADGIDDDLHLSAVKLNEVRSPNFHVPIPDIVKEAITQHILSLVVVVADTAANKPHLQSANNNHNRIEHCHNLSEMIIPALDNCAPEDKIFDIAKTMGAEEELDLIPSYDTLNAAFNNNNHSRGGTNRHGGNDEEGSSLPSFVDLQLKHAAHFIALLRRCSEDLIPKKLQQMLNSRTFYSEEKELTEEKDTNDSPKAAATAAAVTAGAPRTTLPPPPLDLEDNEDFEMLVDDEDDIDEDQRGRRHNLFSSPFSPRQHQSVRTYGEVFSESLAKLACGVKRQDVATATSECGTSTTVVEVPPSTPYRSLLARVLEESGEQSLPPKTQGDLIVVNLVVKKREEEDTSSYSASTATSKHRREGEEREKKPRSFSVEEIRVLKLDQPWTYNDILPSCLPSSTCDSDPRSIVADRLGRILSVDEIEKKRKTLGVVFTVPACFKSEAFIREGGQGAQLFKLPLCSFAQLPDVEANYKKWKQAKNKKVATPTTSSPSSASEAKLALASAETAAPVVLAMKTRVTRDSLVDQTTTTGIAVPTTKDTNSIVYHALELDDPVPISLLPTQAPQPPTTANNNANNDSKYGNSTNTQNEETQHQKSSILVKDLLSAEAAVAAGDRVRQQTQSLFDPLNLKSAKGRKLRVGGGGDDNSNNKKESHDGGLTFKIKRMQATGKRGPPINKDENDDHIPIVGTAPQCFSDVATAKFGRLVVRRANKGNTKTSINTNSGCAKNSEASTSAAETTFHFRINVFAVQKNNYATRSGTVETTSGGDRAALVVSNRPFLKSIPHNAPSMSLDELRNCIKWQHVMIVSASSGLVLWSDQHTSYRPQQFFGHLPNGPHSVCHFTEQLFAYVSNSQPLCNLSTRVTIHFVENRLPLGNNSNKNDSLIEEEDDDMEAEGTKSTSESSFTDFIFATDTSLAVVRDVILQSLPHLDLPDSHSPPKSSNTNNTAAAAASEIRRRHLVWRSLYVDSILNTLSAQDDLEPTKSNNSTSTKSGNNNNTTPNTIIRLGHLGISEGAWISPAMMGAIAEASKGLSQNNESSLLSWKTHKGGEENSQEHEDENTNGNDTKNTSPYDEIRNADHKNNIERLLTKSLLASTTPELRLSFSLHVSSEDTCASLSIISLDFTSALPTKSHELNFTRVDNKSVSTRREVEDSALCLMLMSLTTGLPPVLLRECALYETEEESHTRHASQPRRGESADKRRLGGEDGRTTAATAAAAASSPLPPSSSSAMTHSLVRNTGRPNFFDPTRNLDLLSQTPTRHTRVTVSSFATARVSYIPESVFTFRTAPNKEEEEADENRYSDDDSYTMRRGERTKTAAAAVTNERHDNGEIVPCSTQLLCVFSPKTSAHSFIPLSTRKSLLNAQTREVEKALEEEDEVDIESMMGRYIITALASSAATAIGLHPTDNNDDDFTAQAAFEATNINSWARRIIGAAVAATRGGSLVRMPPDVDVSYV